MTKYIIQHSIIREENHPSFINEWMCGKEGQSEPATFPKKFFAREYGYSSKGHAESAIVRRKKLDARLASMYPVNYTHQYTVVEVNI